MWTANSQNFMTQENAACATNIISEFNVDSNNEEICSENNAYQSRAFEKALVVQFGIDEKLLKTNDLGRKSGIFFEQGN